MSTETVRVTMNVIIADGVPKVVDLEVISPDDEKMGSPTVRDAAEKIAKVIQATIDSLPKLAAS